MAVDSTPDRSFSLLFRSSRAALATTGCTPRSPRCGVVIIARNVASIGRLGSERKLATPARSCPARRTAHAGWCRPAARGWSSPSDCASRARLRDRPARRRCSGRRAPPIRRGALRAADCRRRFGVGRIEQQHAPEPRAPAGGQRPVLALDVVDDRRAGPGQKGRHDQAHALAASRRREAQDMLGTVMAQVVAAPAAE